MKTCYCIAASISMLALTAVARLPEPCNLYYGHLASTDGLVLTGVASFIIAHVNGGEAARAQHSEYLDASVNYVVRVPLDDGWDARYRQFAIRAGERPVFSVLYDGAILPVDTPVPAAGARGAVHHVNLEALPEPCGAVLALILALRAARRGPGM